MTQLFFATKHESPATNDTLLTDFGAVVDAIAESTWPEQDRPDRIGLEIEAFPVVTRDGMPCGRLPLHGPDGVLSAVAQLSRRDGLIGGMAGDPPTFPTRTGGRLTFEPGGQIEHSTRAHRDTAGLTQEVDEVWAALSEVLFQEGVSIAPLGLDPWHGIDVVPQQQRSGRYVAMDDYFSGAWAAGAVMMRNTCSIQVNLEAGRGMVREERWLAANLVSPILTALFASSPGRQGEANLRARTWQSLDPTRTGLPAWDGLTEASPGDDIRLKALSANVMFVSRDGRTTAMEPGWTFSEWARDGHPTFGRPTITDLETHLSTLFAEVRPRNATLELRAIDALPRRWWLVPGVVTAALLYDDHARGQTIELLSRHAAGLHPLWLRAAETGLADPDLGRTAKELAQLVVGAARRQGCFDSEAVRVTEEFFDRFTMRGLSPGDELRTRLDTPATALRWALGDPEMEATSR